MGKKSKILSLLGLMLLGMFIGLVPFLVSPLTLSMVSTQRLMQLVLTIMVFLLPALVFYKQIPMRFLPTEETDIHREDNGNEVWSVRPVPSRARTYIYIVELIVALIPAMNLITWLCQQMPLPEAIREMADNLQFLQQSAMKSLLWTSSPWETMYVLLVVAVTPAIAEEFCFRGAAMGLLRGDDRSKTSKRVQVIVWCIALIFSLIHADIYGFLPRVLLGAILGYLLVWTGSIWVPVFFHFLNNALVASLGMLQANNEGLWRTLSERAEEIGSADTWWLGLLGVVVSVMLLWSIYKHEVGAEKQ